MNSLSSNKKCLKINDIQYNTIYNIYTIYNKSKHKIIQLSNVLYGLYQLRNNKKNIYRMLQESKSINATLNTHRNYCVKWLATTMCIQAACHMLILDESNDWLTSMIDKKAQFSTTIFHLYHNIICGTNFEADCNIEIRVKSKSCSHVFNSLKRNHVRTCGAVSSKCHGDEQFYTLQPKYYIIVLSQLTPL